MKLNEMDLGQLLEIFEGLTDRQEALRIMQDRLDVAERQELEHIEAVIAGFKSYIKWRQERNMLLRAI